jgi:hypothetical protein
MVCLAAIWASEQLRVHRRPSLAPAQGHRNGYRQGWCAIATARPGEAHERIAIGALQWVGFEGEGLVDAKVIDLASLVPTAREKALMSCSPTSRR